MGKKATSKKLSQEERDQLAKDLEAAGVTEESLDIDFGTGEIRKGSFFEQKPAAKIESKEEVSPQSTDMLELKKQLAEEKALREKDKAEYAANIGRLRQEVDAIRKAPKAEIKQPEITFEEAPDVSDFMEMLAEAPKFVAWLRNYVGGKIVKPYVDNRFTKELAPFDEVRLAYNTNKHLLDLYGKHEDAPKMTSHMLKRLREMPEGPIDLEKLYQDAKVVYTREQETKAKETEGKKEVESKPRLVKTEDLIKETDKRTVEKSESEVEEIRAPVKTPKEAARLALEQLEGLGA